MAKSNLSTLLLLLVAISACMAFAPSTQSRASTSLFAQNGLNNAYARGGKNSWEFENETMFVEEPKKAAKKAPVKAAAKKAPVKAAAKKAPVKAAAKKEEAPKKKLFGLF